MTSRHVATLLLVAVMVVWGSTFVITKDAIAELPPQTMAFIRVSIGALVLLPFAVYRRLRMRPHNPPLPWGAIAMLGFVGVAAYYLTFNLALSLTSAAQGALVQSSIPAMTALAGVVVLRERASRRRVIGIALSITGVLIVFSGAAASGSDAASSTPGNLLMIASAVLWGLYTALAKRVAGHDSVVITACIIGSGALMLLPFALLELGGKPLPAISIGAWAGVIYLGAIASGMAFLIYNYALRYMDAGQAGVFANLIPVVGVLSGVVVLHEPLSWRAIAGGLVVMVGVWITGGEKEHMR